MEGEELPIRDLIEDGPGGPDRGRKSRRRGNFFFSRFLPSVRQTVAAGPSDRHPQHSSREPTEGKWTRIRTGGKTSHFGHYNFPARVFCSST